MGDNQAAMPGGEDRLSVLPDEVIQPVLSFLQSSEAVQTCVLATRWRNLWKSAPSLFIDSFFDSSWYSADFVNSLLRCRNPTPLDECQLYAKDDCTDEFHRDAERWLRYVLSCKVRVLTFHVWNCLEGLPLPGGALISQHLTRLYLYRVGSDDFPLDVSSCQSLEELEIDQSVVTIGTDFPKSLRILTIRDADFLPKDGDAHIFPTRSFISAPGLVTLELADCLWWTPFLKTMPSLVTALIRIGHHCLDTSYEHNFCKVCGASSCVQCYDIDHRVLLEGLSSATNLELISPNAMIFRREMKWCPVFSKLKTLLLGNWFMTANFSGLVYFLKHSPVLEMLSLELSICSKKIKTSKVYKPKEQFFVSKHLKAVKIKYCEELGKIDQILSVLAYHGVQPELIDIEMEPYIECLSNQCQSHINEA